MSLLTRFLDWFHRAYLDELTTERHRIEEEARAYNGRVIWRDE